MFMNFFPGKTKQVEWLRYGKKVSTTGLSQWRSDPESRTGFLKLWSKTLFPVQCGLTRCLPRTFVLKCNSPAAIQKTYRDELGI